MRSTKEINQEMTKKHIESRKPKKGLLMRVLKSGDKTYRLEWKDNQ